jgi:hypothetical protein
MYISQSGFIFAPLQQLHLSLSLSLTLSLSLSHTYTHTCEINWKLVQTHVFGDTDLPLSSSTHAHQKASHGISEFSVKSQENSEPNQSLEFGPKEGEIKKPKPKKPA